MANQAIRHILEPNLTDEQIVKLYLHYKEQDEKLKEKHPKLFLECKNFWRLYKNEILRDPKNAHLRRSIYEDIG